MLGYANIFIQEFRKLQSILIEAVKDCFYENVVCFKC